MFGKFIKEANNYVMSEKENVCTINSDVEEFVAFNVLKDGKIIINVDEGGLLFTGISNTELKNLDLVVNANENTKLVLTFNLGSVARDVNFNIHLNQCANSLVVINSIVDVKNKVNHSISGIVQENCSTELNCLINTGTRELDGKLNYNVIHEGSNSINSINVVGVLNSKSKCNFEGSININSDLKEINSTMDNFFLCDDGAKVSSVPILNLKSKDVSTSHSVSIVNIDDYKVEYLASKGLSFEEGRELLKHAKLKEMIDKMASTFKKSGVRL